jgi:hypothetical protein
VAGEFHDGGATEIGADGFEEKEEEFGVGVLAEWPAASKERAQAELRKCIANDGVVLVAAAGEDGDVVDGAVGMGAEEIEGGADSFADFGWFTGGGEE